MTQRRKYTWPRTYKQPAGEKRYPLSLILEEPVDTWLRKEAQKRNMTLTYFVNTLLRHHYGK